MNKQEFLAMSLPYGLIIEVKNNYDNDVKYWQLKPTYLDRDCNCINKIILHPLSDLTKPIEHKGEKFVPSYVLSRDFKSAEDFIFLLIQIINREEDMDLFKTMEYCPINIIQKLIEWHFDIADLISKGEAIDVNTLPENPYK